MNKIKVAPIGTCRIHTPLRRAALHYPFELDLRRNFGFVHSSAEVWQQLDLMLGGEPVPQPLWPMIYRPTVTDEFLRGPTAEPDYFFFEISSRKNLTVDGYPVQINYLYRYFPEFFQEKHLAAEFWALTRRGEMEQRQEWLNELPVYRNMSADKKALFDKIDMKDMSDEQIGEDMRRLADRVGADKCIFITHVNAITSGGKVILSRQKLIQSVTRLAKKMKLRYFDPTEDMRAFGQQFAMERDGADTTHYTLPFSEHLGAFWFEEYVQSQMEGVDQAELARAKSARRIMARLDSMLRQGQLVKVSTELHELIRNGEGSVHALRLLAKLSAQLGDYQRVVDTLQKLAAATEMTDEDDSVLMVALVAMGEYQQAWDIGRRLIANEKEDDFILAACAQTAAALGLTEEAIRLWTKLREGNEDNKVALVGLLQVYQKAGRKVEALAVADEILLNHPDEEIALVAKWGDAIVNPLHVQFDELIKQSKWFSDETSLRLAKLADQNGKVRLAASLLALKPHIFSKSEYFEANEMRSRWESKGLDSLSNNDFAAAAQYLGAAAKATEKEKDAEALRKQLAIRFRLDVRAAYSAKNYEKVLRIAEAAEPYGMKFPGFYRLVGKAAVQTGNIAVALRYLKADTAEDNSPEALLYLGRLAVKGQEYLLAYRSYHAVVAHPDASSEDVDVAKKAMGDRFGAALKQVRHLAEIKSYDDAWALMDQLALSSDDEERIEKERNRILRLIRIDFKAVDAENAPERLVRAEQYLRLDPTDLSLRRLAAIAAMRCENYPAARDHWLALAAHGEMTPQIESALEKCATLIERAERRKAA